MSKITKNIKTAIKISKTANDIKNMVLSPVTMLRNEIKNLIIKYIIFMIKSTIKLSLFSKKEQKFGCENLLIKQLHALTDKNADLSNISKEIMIDINLDSLIKKISDERKSNIINYIPKKYKETKNYIRKILYDYVTENDFENLNDIIEDVNMLINTPTNLAGLNYISSSVDEKRVDPKNEDFSIRLKVIVGLISSD